MKCISCNIEIDDNAKFCPQCGHPVGTPAEIPKPKPPPKTLITSELSTILGIIGFANYKTLWGLILGKGSLLLGLFALLRISFGKGKYGGERYAIYGVILGLLTLIFGAIYPAILARQTKTTVARVHADLRTLATAMESYYIDNMVYPRVDLDDQNNPITPTCLTTPVAFIKELPHDPFHNNGKNYYGLSGGPIAPGGIKETWIAGGFIVTSYGPDRVSGFSGVPNGEPLRLEVAWLDTIFMGFFPYSLHSSPFTYDPTNGLYSSGDIWIRGPDMEASP